MPGHKAVVVGGTGAVGREIVSQLVTSGNWAVVTTVGRRPVELPEPYKSQPAKAQLEQKVINMDYLGTEAAEAFQGADAVFCALGTTRGDAGSAAAFKKVDYEYVAATAEAAKAAGARMFSLVSAQGANSKLPAGDFVLLHPLLYSKTKELAEDAVKAQGFPRCAIWRPGLLLRGDKARGWEGLFGKIASGIKVSDVARVMIQDAERSLDQSVHGTSVYEMGAMQKAAKSGTPPPAP